MTAEEVQELRNRFIDDLARAFDTGQVFLRYGGEVTTEIRDLAMSCQELVEALP